MYPSQNLSREKMDERRKPLAHNPTANFTMMRDEYKKNEDLRLVKHFASWLSKVGERPVREETFEEDLLDGVCLCKLMSKINGSGVVDFHTLPSSTVPPLEMFKGKENMVQFQVATKKLNLPISFGTEDLEKKNITRVVSTLIFLAHVAHSQGVTVDDMDQEILDKVVEMDEAIEQQVASAQLSWFQQLLVRLGLGEWISMLSIDALKQYLLTLKKNLEEKAEEQKTIARQRSEKLQEVIQEKTASWKEALPDAIKTRITAN
jgi:predicted transport protein